MKIFIGLILLTLVSLPSLLDFSYLNSAKEAYHNREYKKAEEFYSKVESDEARFNRGDALYRQKKYKEAIDIYNSINDKKLEYKKLHNIGNCYANLNQIDKAIESYKEALKIKQDRDTKFNLKLLQKKKKQQQKEQEREKKQNNTKDNKNQKQNSSKKNNHKDMQKEDKNRANNQKEKSLKEQDSNKTNNKRLKKSEYKKEEPPISNMEERKWEKMLNQKGVNTLMLPLNRKKGDKIDETNLW